MYFEILTGTDNQIHISITLHSSIPLITAASEKLRDNFAVVLAALERVSKANEVNVHTIYIYTHTHTRACVPAVHIDWRWRK